jgi:hypothetical protein
MLSIHWHEAFWTRVKTCFNYFVGIQELLWIIVNSYELLWITMNCLNHSELLGITLVYLDFLFYFLTGLLIFLLGHLGLSTGFCWGYFFWQLNRTELLWITVNCCELLWINRNFWNNSEFLWFTLNNCII